MKKIFAGMTWIELILLAICFLILLAIENSSQGNSNIPIVFPLGNIR